MFWNYLIIALRNLRKNKLFALINLIGLTVGITAYVFAELLLDYETTHDSFFRNSDRIYTVSSVDGPAMQTELDQIKGAAPAVSAIIKANLPDVEATARITSQNQYVTFEDNTSTELVMYADPELLDIFDFTYIAGNADALDDPSGLVLTEATAIKYFGRTDVVGEAFTLEHQYEFHVSAVIVDIPENSHFHSLRPFTTDYAIAMLVPLKTFEKLYEELELDTNWRWAYAATLTYALLPPSLDQNWIQSQLDDLYDRHAPERAKQRISGLRVNPLYRANLRVWDGMGIPITIIFPALGLLVLAIACINYINLATAQSFSRSREVGMRKTMGATKRQLLGQFLAESTLLAAFAMITSVAILEIAIPLFNNLAGKNLILSYSNLLPGLISITLFIGLLAGFYPAWLATRMNPINALRDIARTGKRGVLVRNLMISTQFVISAFMFAVVAVIFMQNEKVKDASNVYPKSEIYTSWVENDQVHLHLDNLYQELMAVPNVVNVAYSTSIPYGNTNSRSYATSIPGDETSQFEINLVGVSTGFLETYDIPILAGRNLDRAFANDLPPKENSETINVIVNELLLTKMGISAPQEAIGQRLYEMDTTQTLKERVIVGVFPTQNFNRITDSEVALVLSLTDRPRSASIRFGEGDYALTVKHIEDVWSKVVPGYPLDGYFLDDIFNHNFSWYRVINQTLAGLSLITLTLAMVGLFGLAVFTTNRRTREIGVRKALGASSAQIMRLFVWQLSKPMLWALLIALPGAFFAANIYLNNFAERISPFPVLVMAGALAIFIGWITVAGQTYKAARANPVDTLRYE